MTPFTVFYGDDAQANAWLNDERLLALVRFGEPASARPDARICEVALTELGGTATAEVWLGARPARIGVTDGIRHASDGEVLFLQLRVDEYAPDALQPLTAVAYRRLFAMARALGYPHFLRIWNYFSEINQECEGVERYRAFCAGRHQALVAELAEFETRLPAASAIGTHGPGLQLYGLAARQPGAQIENPRQVSAFHYPRQYGRRSPSFSRAVLKTWGEGREHLYISGTASIVGHASQHGDLLPQLDETVANLEALLAEANRRAAAPLGLALLKIYIRPDLDPKPLRGRIAQAFGTDAPMLFLRADIAAGNCSSKLKGWRPASPPATVRTKPLEIGKTAQTASGVAGLLPRLGATPRLRARAVRPHRPLLRPCQPAAVVRVGESFRRRALARIGLQPGMTVLNVAIGTGLVARQAVAITGDSRAVIGLDVSAGMLAEVRRLLGIPLVQGLMEQLPVADACCDLVSMGYALRHVADLNATFREFHRVLRPGGVLLILEIAHPTTPFKRAMLKFYLGRLIPLLGRLTTGQRDMQTLMRYYWDPIENCVPPETIIQAIRDAGFAEAGCDVELDLFRAYFGRKGSGA